MLPAVDPDDTRRLRAAFRVVAGAWALTLAFDGLAFLALLMAMGYAQGADVLLILAMIGGVVTPLIGVAGAGALLAPVPRTFEALATFGGALALLLLQWPSCLWLGTSIRW